MIANSSRLSLLYRNGGSERLTQLLQLVNNRTKIGFPSCPPMHTRQELNGPVEALGPLSLASEEGGARAHNRTSNGRVMIFQVLMLIEILIRERILIFRGSPKPAFSFYQIKGKEKPVSTIEYLSMVIPDSGFCNKSPTSEGKNTTGAYVETSLLQSRAATLLLCFFF